MHEATAQFFLWLFRLIKWIVTMFGKYSKETTQSEINMQSGENFQSDVQRDKNPQFRIMHMDSRSIDKQKSRPTEYR